MVKRTSISFISDNFGKMNLSKDVLSSWSTKILNFLANASISDVSYSGFINFLMLVGAYKSQENMILIGRIAYARMEGIVLAPHGILEIREKLDSITTSLIPIFKVQWV